MDPITLQFDEESKQLDCGCAFIRDVDCESDTLGQVKWLPCEIHAEAELTRTAWQELRDWRTNAEADIKELQRKADEFDKIEGERDELVDRLADQTAEIDALRNNIRRILDANGSTERELSFLPMMADTTGSLTWEKPKLYGPGEDERNGGLLWNANNLENCVFCKDRITIRDPFYAKPDGSQPAHKSCLEKHLVTHEVHKREAYALILAAAESAPAVPSYKAKYHDNPAAITPIESPKKNTTPRAKRAKVR